MKKKLIMSEKSNMMYNTRNLCLVLGVLILGMTLFIGAGAATVVDSGTCGDNLNWVLTDDGTLTISGTGDMYDYSNSINAPRYPPWYQYRNQMTKLVLSPGITKIGMWAFLHCSGFTGSLPIPDTVKTIGYGGYMGCYGFTGPLVIPNNVTKIGDSAFSMCTNLSGVLSIPKNLTWIGSNAFSGCTGFTGPLTIPDNVKTIGQEAFSGCTGFTGELTLSNGIEYIGSNAFHGCNGFTGSITIPDSVQMIGGGAFSGCNGFTGTLTLPMGLKEIWSDVFSGCSGLTGSLNIPNNVTIIDVSAFWGCSGLTGSLTLPNNLTRIGAGAFHNCSGFTGTVMIPASVAEIRDNPFEGCSGLREITVNPSNLNYSSDSQGILYNVDKTILISCPGYKAGSFIDIPNTVTIIGNGAFWGRHDFIGDLIIPNSVTSIGKNAFWSCSCLTSIEIPDSVMTIGDGAFSCCSAITHFTIPLNLTVINMSVFSECSSLTSVDIPSSITTIGEKAFYKCGALTNLQLPNGLTTIGYYAFDGCGCLTSVTIPSSVTSINSHAFSNLNSNSLIYAECSPSILSSYCYTAGKTAVATSKGNNAYSFTVDKNYFTSGFPLTVANAPNNTGCEFGGWYSNPRYSGEKVTIASNNQTLYAKWLTADLTLYPGWNVVSLPKTLASDYDTATELFAGVDTMGNAILSYNAQTKSWEQITASTKLSPLNAYWIYSNSSKALSYEFSSTVSTPAVKNVYKGWNAVGLSANAPQSAAQTFGNTNWYTYLEWNATTQTFKDPITKGFTDSNLVSLWTGGWLYLNEDGTYMGFTA